MNDGIENLTARERALLHRGYAMECILQFSRLPDPVIAETAARISESFPEQPTHALRPKCIFLGGQAGCGKSTWSRHVNTASNGEYVEIGLDRYRTWHPDYEKIEEVIRAHWVGREETPDDTPGNDIADFTHRFAGAVTDLVIERAEQRRLNLLLEWGLRTPAEPLQMMSKLSAAGYRISVCFVAVNGKTSLEACRQRADIMNSYGHIMRRVSDEFHSLAVSMLPDSCSEIYQQAVLKHHWCDDFRIVNRNGDILWQNGASGNPGVFYRECLDGSSEAFWNDPSEAYRSAETELQGLLTKRT